MKRNERYHLSVPIQSSPVAPIPLPSLLRALSCFPVKKRSMVVRLRSTIRKHAVEKHALIKDVGLVITASNSTRHQVWPKFCVPGNHKVRLHSIKNPNSHLQPYASHHILRLIGSRAAIHVPVHQADKRQGSYSLVIWSPSGWVFTFPNRRHSGLRHLWFLSAWHAVARRAPGRRVPARRPAAQLS